jgi:hypothetical protein
LNPKMSATLNWRGDDWLEQAQKKALESLFKGGEKILSRAMGEVPWSSGELGGSGDVQQEGETKIVVSFNTPYAHYQHENVLQHPNPRDPRSLGGRKDHYLRDPLYDLQDEILSDLAEDLSG